MSMKKALILAVGAVWMVTESMGHTMAAFAVLALWVLLE